MDEFLPIKQYVARFISLTEEEEKQFASFLRITRVKKKQQIVQPDFVCKYRSFVISGCMKAYLLDLKGQNHTIAFAIENWWISDYNSYINQEPATFFVEAIEDTVLIQIDYNSEQLLMNTIPKFERFFRIITQRSLGFMQRRLLSNLSLSAEERYEEMLRKYPEIVNRVPQYCLAAYLGFSNEFLSKIRNKRVKKLN